MKILKILLILLVPALGIVSCHKSDRKPCSKNTTESSSTEQNKNVSGRSYDVTTETEEEDGTSVVGSGDDDRNGGDKKKKVKN